MKSLFGLAFSLFLLVGFASDLEAQMVESESTVVNVAVGNSFAIVHPLDLERVMVSNENIADPVAVSTREVVVNGMQIGTTTLTFWDTAGDRHTFSVRVTADVDAIQSEIDRVMPNSGVTVSAVGNSVVLAGEVDDPRSSERAESLAGALSGEGGTILNYISTPDPGQIMLSVRVAEVNRTNLESLGVNLLRMDPDAPLGGNEWSFQSGGVPAPSGSVPGSGVTQTFSDAVNFYLFNRSADVGAFIQALQSEGVFRSLAEPNLTVVPGEEASFLAGGEFPYPQIQPQTGQVSVQFREFGIVLNFTPTITNSGAIRLAVEPEVSSLDFSSGVSVGGTTVPALLTRRAQTTIELEAGQTFAIAGLMDSEITEDVNRVPFLGDIPVLGAFFRSSEARENKTELLVLVTPQFVQASDDMPETPTGEADTWPWSDFMTRPLRIVPPDARGGGL